MARQNLRELALLSLSVFRETAVIVIVKNLRFLESEGTGGPKTHRVHRPEVEQGPASIASLHHSLSSPNSGETSLLTVKITIVVGALVGHLDNFIAKGVLILINHASHDPNVVYHPLDQRVHLGQKIGGEVVEGRVLIARNFGPCRVGGPLWFILKVA